jgi:hypothetical protein
LRVAETGPKFVGKGIALVEPKVIRDLVLSTGDVVKILGVQFPLISNDIPNSNHKSCIQTMLHPTANALIISPFKLSSKKIGNSIFVSTRP